MARLRDRQKEEVVRRTLARIPTSTGSGGAASQLDANGTILDVDVINNGELLKRVGSSIVSVPAGAPGAHATTHQPGGADPLAVDAAAATGSLRTIGTGALQAAAGNDARLTNARTPTAHATTHQPGGSDAMAVDAAAATGSLRTLGTGATQAVAGNDSRLSDARALAVAVGKPGNVLADDGAAWVSEAWGLSQKALPETIVSSGRHYMAVGPFTVPAGRTLTVSAGDTFLVAE